MYMCVYLCVLHIVSDIFKHWNFVYLENSLTSILGTDFLLNTYSRLISNS